MGDFLLVLWKGNIECMFFLILFCNMICKKIWIIIYVNGFGGSSVFYIIYYWIWRKIDKIFMFWENVGNGLIIWCDWNMRNDWCWYLVLFIYFLNVLWNIFFKLFNYWGRN